MDENNKSKRAYMPQWSTIGCPSNNKTKNNLN
jgi:hypothetical protein